MDVLDLMNSDSDPTGLHNLCGIDEFRTQLNQDLNLLILGTLDASVARIEQHADQLREKLDETFKAAPQAEERHDDELAQIEHHRSEQVQFICKYSLVALVDLTYCALSSLAKETHSRLPKDGAPIDDALDPGKELAKARSFIHIRKEIKGRERDTPIINLRKQPKSNNVRLAKSRLIDARKLRNAIVHRGAELGTEPSIPVDGEDPAPRKPNHNPNSALRYLPECIDDLGHISIPHEVIERLVRDAEDYVGWVIGELRECWRVLSFAETARSR